MTDEGRILVVDDSEAARFIKVQILRRAGFGVDEASTGAEAVEQVRAARPVLVILDVNLPDISGLEVCRWLKEDAGPPSIQVLHVSQTAVTDADRARGLDGGADMYLTEPFGSAVLLATVRALLRVRRAEAALERALDNERLARDEAQRANRTKDEFLAMVSHELRTPLNAMTGWIWQLKRGALDEESYRRAIDVLDRNARIQVQLINDLLDVSRISTGKLDIHLEPIDVRQVVETAAAAANDSPLHKRKQIVLEVQADSAAVLADAARLHQVVTNILNNAFQFTPAGGRILVTSGVEPDGAFIRVEDSGAGIDPEFLPHVFERFQQARTLGRGGEPGLGLGLAIVRDLVERHHGSVRLESEGAGRGTTVTVRLPVLDPSIARQPVEVPVPTGILEGLRLLVVEDDTDARDVLHAILVRYGANVATAGTAEAAERLATEAVFDVLVTDIGLPDAKGTELVKRLRALGRTMPAIAVTAFATEVDRRRLLADGFVAHVAKPVDPQRLVRAVAEAARAHAETGHPAR
jgi:signal transduction histidine kinase/BarA-like signal transduction histidine kinase